MCHEDWFVHTSKGRRGDSGGYEEGREDSLYETECVFLPPGEASLALVCAIKLWRCPGRRECELRACECSRFGALCCLPPHLDLSPLSFTLRPHPVYLAHPSPDNQQRLLVACCPPSVPHVVHTLLGVLNIPTMSPPQVRHRRSHPPAIRFAFDYDSSFCLSGPGLPGTCFLLLDAHSFGPLYPSTPSNCSWGSASEVLGWDPQRPLGVYGHSSLQFQI